MSDMNNYRNLTDSEVKCLESQACRCDNWSLVSVSADFSTDYIIDVVFSGVIRLGSFKQWHTLDGGYKIHSGIVHARLHDCTMGNDVLIYNVGAYIANYDIDDEAVLVDVGTLCMDGTSSFCNGESVYVLRESQGMNVRIYDGLSSQSACLQVYYKHRPKMLAQLDVWIDKYAAEVTSRRGSVGRAAMLKGCSYVCNVRVAPYARLLYADRLTEGTVLSSGSAPSIVGVGVIADHFIISEGAVVDDHARLYHCFVGQASKLGRSCSAEHSIFFANSIFMQGEAVSLFAGPFTVSHHKSTLLIAGHCSFMNAGSATNQSNHLYKTGPVHYGLLERGCKTGSGAYIKWPACAGAFSVIVGKHVSHFDTSDFPFSYLIEQDSHSMLVPAANLCTSGVARDVLKWPKRDERRAERVADRVHFQLWSPYIMQKIVRAQTVLKQLLATGVQPFYHYKGVTVSEKAIRKGIDRYQLAVDRYIGEMLQMHAAAEFPKLATDSCPRWLDLGGMFLTEISMNGLLADIESGRISSLVALECQLDHCYNHYADDEWQWFLSFFKVIKGKSLDELTVDECELIQKRALLAEEEFQQRINDDAARDTALSCFEL